MNEIRPRTLGEILDRAVSLFTRHAAPLATILAIVGIPLLIFQIIALPETTRGLSDLQRVFAASHDPQAMQRVLAQINAGQSTTWLGLFWLITSLFAPLGNVAFFFATWQLFTGMAVHIGAAYHVAIRRWFAAIVASLSFGVIAIGAAIPLFIAYLIVVIGIAAIVHAAPIVGIVVGIVLGLALFVAFLAGFAVFYVAWQLALIAVATEQSNPFRAIGLGLRRTFTGGALVKSVLVGIVTVTISFGGSILLATASGGIAALTHIAVLYPILAAIGGLLLNGLIAVFLVGYALDVRVRREGFDLDLETQMQAAT
jgi:hypothetical protein